MSLRRPIRNSQGQGILTGDDSRRVKIGSREQNYRPEDCGICHAALTGKKGRGFWEGGKGTRDQMRMSRKDPRKYKRKPGSKPKT